MDQNDWRRDPIWQAVGTIVSVVAVLLAALALPNEVRALGVIIVLLGAVLCFLFLFKRPFGASNRLSQQPPLAEKPSQPYLSTSYSILRIAELERVLRKATWVYIRVFLSMAVPYTTLLLYLYFAFHGSLVPILCLALLYIYIVMLPAFFHDETIRKETKDEYQDRRSIKDAIERERRR